MALAIAAVAYIWVGFSPDPLAIAFIPAAILLAIGNWLDWGWAEETTEVLHGVWVASVEQAKVLWSRAG